jgi:putative ATP-dependent endonuclease of OLD family
VFLEKITIINFRIFGENGVNVIFNKGVNAVIGENNSGKSALIDAIRIAFSSILYKKDIFFNKTDFHVDAQGKRAKTAQIDVYLKDVPQNLIEIWDPENITAGEFHLLFYIDTLPSGFEKVKCRAWGGKIEGNALSADIFDTMNIAYLTALRDAENEMKPSRSSKLAALLNTITNDNVKKTELVAKLQNANNSILEAEQIKRIKEIINVNLINIEQGILRQQIDIGLVEPRFESITSSLRAWIIPRWFFIDRVCPHYTEIVEICSRDIKLHSLINEADNGAYLDIAEFLESDIAIDEELKLFLSSLMNYSFELYQNGLGYNNLLFMSAVLGDMSLDKAGIYLNIFTIEEPEAHLHPQLQELIHSFFENRCNNSSLIQIIYTSHSPTLVSRIGINAINLLFERNHSICCYPLSHASLTDMEKDYLEKYLDVTKSQIFFAKGALFVEGISEAMLLPEFAKLLNRPFDKYAVELINISGTAFSPFVKILTLPDGTESFARSAIITDDDRCTDVSKNDTYISKELDFNSVNDDLTCIAHKLHEGSVSMRFKKIYELCSGKNINVWGARKTFEYELALKENNIPYLLSAIIEAFPNVGPVLKEYVDKEPNLINKAILIWLFVRAREKSKAQIAQALSRIIRKEIKESASGNIIEKPFTVPDYIANAIYDVTEAKG